MAAVTSTAAQQLERADPKPEPAWVQLLFQRTNPDAELNAARLLATSAERTLTLSCSLAIAGRVLDLSGLENWIGRLIASVLDLDPADGRRIRPTLIGLLDGLDRLEHTIATRAPPITAS